MEAGGPGKTSHRAGVPSRSPTAGATHVTPKVAARTPTISSASAPRRQPSAGRTSKLVGTPAIAIPSGSSTSQVTRLASPAVVAGCPRRVATDRGSGGGSNGTKSGGTSASAAPRSRPLASGTGATASSAGGCTETSGSREASSGRSPPSSSGAASGAGAASAAATLPRPETPSSQPVAKSAARHAASPSATAGEGVFRAGRRSLRNMVVSTPSGRRLGPVDFGVNQSR